MKIEIESTDKVTEIDGVQVRLWNGTTDQGVKCLVFVHRLAVKYLQDQSQFQKELKEMQAPVSIERVIPLSQILFGIDQT